MQSSSDTIALPGFELDLAQMLLRDAAGAEVRLRPQAFAVLQFLARHAGRVVTKDELNPSARARWIVAARGDWSNPQARALFLEGARLAGMPE